MRGLLVIACLFLSCYVTCDRTTKPVPLRNNQTESHNITRRAPENPEHTDASNSTTIEVTTAASCVCHKIYDPVCASNNKTYSNQCVMECDHDGSNVTVVHHGNCIPF